MSKYQLDSEGQALEANRELHKLFADIKMGKSGMDAMTKRFNELRSKYGEELFVRDEYNKRYEIDFLQLSGRARRLYGDDEKKRVEEYTKLLESYETKICKTYKNFETYIDQKRRNERDARLDIPDDKDAGLYKLKEYQLKEYQPKEYKVKEYKAKMFGRKEKLAKECAEMKQEILDNSIFIEESYNELFELIDYIYS